MNTSTKGNQSRQTGPLSDAPQREAEVSVGTIRYREAGSGPTILFVHGVLVDGRLWDGVADLLAQGHRCILPDLPLGSHTIPMNRDADLTPASMTGVVAELIETVAGEPVTVIGNDSGGAISQMLVARRPELLSHLVLTNCDTHDNFPPFPFTPMPHLPKVPGGVWALGASMRLRPLRRATFGLLTKRPIPDELLKSWGAPLATNPRIREDMAKLLSGLEKDELVRATANLANFDRPTLLAWASEDRLFPIERAEEILASMPDARLERIPDARAFVSLDQPERLAGAISSFLEA